MLARCIGRGSLYAWEIMARENYKSCCIHNMRGGRTIQRTRGTQVGGSKIIIEQITIILIKKSYYSLKYSKDLLEKNNIGLWLTFLIKKMSYFNWIIFWHSYHLHNSQSCTVSSAATYYITDAMIKSTLNQIKINIFREGSLCLCF